MAKESENPIVLAGRLVRGDATRGDCVGAAKAIRDLVAENKALKAPVSMDERQVHLYLNDPIYHAYVDWTAALVKAGSIKRGDLNVAISWALALVDREAPQ